MDTKKIGKFLAELRKEKGVTQEQVGYELMTSRENISKWERGINTPTPDSLLLLSKYYDVSVNEILLGERKTEENKEQIENVSVEVMKAGEKRVKTVLKNFVIVIAFMTVSFLAYYFVNTYNTIKVYKIDGMSDNFYIKDGLAIFSKGKSYLRIGNIEPKSDIEFDGFEIFIKDKGAEQVAFYSDDDNYTLISNNGYKEIYSYNNLKNIEKDTYIKIKYQGKEDVIKLNFQRDMTNNLFMNKNETDVVDEDVKYNNNIVQKLESYVKENWKFNNETSEYSYNYVDGNINYVLYYLPNLQILRIESFDNKIRKIVEINLVRSLLSYSEDNNDNLQELYQYKFSTNKCLSVECNKEQINYYLDNFLYKYIK